MDTMTRSKEPLVIDGQPVERSYEQSFADLKNPSPRPKRRPTRFTPEQREEWIRQQREELERLKKDVQIVDYARDNGYSLKRVGAQYYELEQHSSSRIDPVRNIFYYNAANIKGSIVDFIKFVHPDMDNEAAIKELKAYAGVIQISPQPAIPMNSKRRATSQPLGASSNQQPCIAPERIHSVLRDVLENGLLKSDNGTTLYRHFLRTKSNLEIEELLKTLSNEVKTMTLRTGQLANYSLGMEGLTIDSKSPPPLHFLFNPSETVSALRGFYNSEQWPFTLPERFPGRHSRLFAYLSQSRCIDYSVIGEMVKRLMLFEDKRHNVVFAGYDKSGVPLYAGLRTTITDGTFKGEMPISDKSVGWYASNNSKSLFVTEAPIDAMSVMTLFKHYGTDYKRFDYLALGGTALNALRRVMKENPNQYDRIYLGSDNDDAGHGVRTEARKYLQEIGFSGKILDKIPTKGKDWNQELCQCTELWKQEKAIRKNLEQANER